MNIVLEIQKSGIQEVIQMLDSKNLERRENPSGISFRTDGAVITIYNTGKIMVQGKNSKVWEGLLLNFMGIDKGFEKSKDHSQEKLDKEDVLYNLPSFRIGSDESGKGDFFGPLVTVAFLLQSKDVEHSLIELGVTDSKKLSDKKILEIAPKLKKIGTYQVVKIGPEKYNTLYSRMKNINKILGWSHARAIENILVNHDCTLAVADQFGDESIIQKTLFEKGKKINLIQTHKAERDIAVAAASILARYTFIEAIQSLKNKIGHEIPLGAGEQVVTAGVEIAKRNGVDYLKDITKNHFKTFEMIKNRL